MLVKSLLSYLTRRQGISHIKVQTITRSSRNTSDKTVATNANIKQPRVRVGRVVLLVGTGGFIGLYCYRSLRKPPDDQPPKLATNFQVNLYRKMPLKAVSRAWGKMTSMDLPVSLRQPLLGLYVWMFDVKLHEANDDNLKNYKNLSEFFRRQLKPNIREISVQSPVTSPADGKILHFGKVENGVVEQVKGVNYAIKGFLGPHPSKTAGSESETSTLQDGEYQKAMNIKQGHSLYHCIIYLAPGDYHRFHSPTDWCIAHRRHFPGELLSVNPGVARWVQGLFSFNERAVYSGTWKYGYFSYTAVGATNVGSIKFYLDQDLETNAHKSYPENSYFDKSFGDNGSSVHVAKGDMLGEFNLGSTIVLMFEAPNNYKFCVKPGEKVKYGESLGGMKMKK